MIHSIKLMKISGKNTAKRLVEKKGPNLSLAC